MVNMVAAKRRDKRKGFIRVLRGSEGSEGF
jgi:hypothetical protein